MNVVHRRQIRPTTEPNSCGGRRSGSARGQGGAGESEGTGEPDTEGQVSSCPAVPAEWTGAAEKPAVPCSLPTQCVRLGAALVKAPENAIYPDVDGSASICRTEGFRDTGNVVTGWQPNLRMKPHSRIRLAAFSLAKYSMAVPSGRSSALRVSTMRSRLRAPSKIRRST